MPDDAIIEEGLNGRVTIWDDRTDPDRNGMAYLPACLKSHKPLDLVIIALGTNDTKVRFGLTAADIASGVLQLGRAVLASGCGAANAAPKLLIVCPHHMDVDPSADALSSFDEGSNALSRQLHEKYELVAKQLGCYYLNLGGAIKASPKDGVHLEPDMHASITKMLYDAISRIYASAD